MSSQISVRRIEPIDFELWDEFVATNDGTLFITSRWRQVINAGYGQGGEFAIFGAFHRHRLIGGVCGLERRRFGSKTLVTPLLTPYSGFLLSRDLINSPLVPELEQGQQPEISSAQTATGGDTASTAATIAALAKALSVYRMQAFQCPPAFHHSRAVAGLGYNISPRLTLEIDLRLSEEQLWSRFAGNVRRNIKKAGRGNYAVTDRWDSAKAYDLLGGTFSRRQQKNPVSQQLFDAVTSHRCLAGMRRIYSAWKGDHLHAYIVALEFDKTVYYALAAADDEALKAGLPSLLIWDLLRDYKASGFETFDFVGANTQSIVRFKEGFAPRPQPYLQCLRFASPHMRMAHGFWRWLRSR